MLLRSTIQLTTVPLWWPTGLLYMLTEYTRAREVRGNLGRILHREYSSRLLLCSSPALRSIAKMSLTSKEISFHLSLSLWSYHCIQLSSKVANTKPPHRKWWTQIYRLNSLRHWLPSTLYTKRCLDTERSATNGVWQYFQDQAKWRRSWHRSTGKPSSPEQAKQLMLVFTNAILEDMVKRGVKVDDQEETKSEAEKMSEQVLKDSGEFQ